jgi:hypothetical protein
VFSVLGAELPSTDVVFIVAVITGGSVGIGHSEPWWCGIVSSAPESAIVEFHLMFLPVAEFFVLFLLGHLLH